MPWSSGSGSGDHGLEALRLGLVEHEPGAHWAALGSVIRSMSPASA